MPKCSLDERLHEQAKALMNQYGGNAAAASAALGMDRTKFWRFVRSGRAVAKTRLDIAQRLERHTAVQQEKEKATKTQHTSSTALALTLEEAGQLRDFCRKLISMVDFYEKAAAHEVARSGSSANV